ncbi:MAG TPA: TauD/TfdA family dioxygenase [bacterium]|nr:TauD/TfdA family dioxygenase [bacterium]
MQALLMPGQAHFTALGPALGARIGGVNLSQRLDAATWAVIHRAYLDQHVVSIPGQHLTIEQLLEFSRRFGPLEAHVLNQYHHPRYPEILMLSNVVEGGKPVGLADAGTYWHSDISYKARPSRGTILYALEVPDEGGDTLFCNMEAAYDALPEDMKARLQGLKAVHNYEYRHSQVAKETGLRAPLTEEQRRATPDVVHPVIRTHPETGRRAIYINPGFTVRILGMTEQESEALKRQVFEHCLQERFQYRYKWQVGDVLIWDNASVMHAATTRDLPASKRRTLWRTIISGEEPF